MILPDVNVLIYALRSDSANHATYRTWLESVVNSETAYGMVPQVLAAVIRVATHPKIFVNPSRLVDATSFASVLLAQPHCQIIQPGPRHWDIFLDLCRQTKVAGNLVQDAWLAALAIESGCEWITTDRDFGRFEGLRWRGLAS
jgi:uncharacterized protein